MPVHFQKVAISRRSRFIVFLLRLILKPLMRRWARASHERIARLQLRLAGRRCRDTAGLAQDYRIIGGVPGPTVGAIDDAARPLIFWLHGGGWLLPAVPEVHLRLLALMCRETGAAGFLPDYRLAPFNPFPACLDDAERAWRGLLDAGFEPSRIVLAGDSAGGHLALGLLQRLRAAGLAMPACALLLSPVTELGRVHAPPSRCRNARRDAIIPAATLSRLDALFTAGQDTAHPEISPLYADYRGFPPLYFLAGEQEVLLDDSLLAARQAEAAGVSVRVDVWPHLPHAFPLFERLFPELAQVRTEMAGFIRDGLAATDSSAG